MCEFEKNKRAIYLTERHFLHRKKFLEEDLQEDVFLIKTPQWILDDPDYGQGRYQRGLSWNQISTAMRYCQLLYSAGCPMPEVVSTTHDMLERFHKHFDIDFPEDKLQLWEADSYAYILWLLGLAVLSNHKESLNRIPGWLSPDLDENGERILCGGPTGGCTDEGIAGFGRLSGQNSGQSRTVFSEKRLYADTRHHPSAQEPRQPV